MITFWLIAGIMLLLALLLLARGLLSRKQSIEIDRNEQNLLIAEERLQVAEAEYADRTISESDYLQIKAEIEKTLADELGQETGRLHASSNSGAIGTAAIGVLLPLFGLAMYGLLGSPDFIDTGSRQNAVMTQQHTPATGEEPQSFESMVESLAQKLEQDPDNLEGWFLLGRSLMSLGRYSEAVQAYEVVNEKLPEPQSGVLLALANAVAMSQEGRLEGRPAALVQEALALEPQNTTALWLAGMVAEEAGDPESALRYWEQAEPLLADDPENQAELRGMMRAVAEKLGRSPGPDASAAVQPDTFEVPKASPAPGDTKEVRVRVSLSPEARAAVSPEATVFIFARAVEGPPMPLAASRHRVSELPLELTLDDSMAMMPQMKISAFEEVSVTAKISMSGTADASPDDRSSEQMRVALPTSGVVELVIR
ncbi:MAG: c-type cytochrome biogenesis protein CcmI [Sedimenticolaceae bacterium]|nr:c-type cytochrome biogenesis protein CcmI [Sedimenticolaceae bacterium]